MTQTGRPLRLEASYAKKLIKSKDEVMLKKWRKTDGGKNRIKGNASGILEHANFYEK